MLLAVVTLALDITITTYWLDTYSTSVHILNYDVSVLPRHCFVIRFNMHVHPQGSIEVT